MRFAMISPGSAGPANAYALLAAAGIEALGLVWYPLKRLISVRGGRNEDHDFSCRHPREVEQKRHSRRLIRIAILAVAVLNLPSCSQGERATIDTIEIHRSGWISYNVIVHANGKGEFEGSRAVPENGKRTFALKPGQFDELASSIQPYLRLARPVTDASIRDVVERKWPKCPANTRDVTDEGALYLHWRGPQKNVHYVVDLGCDETRNYERNLTLLHAVYQLPIRELVGPFA